MKDKETKDFKEKKNFKDGKGKGYKQRKPKTKKENRNDESTSGAPFADKSNDVTWYIPDEQLLKDAANLPFANMIGINNNIAMSNTMSTSPSTTQLRVGSIMTHTLIPMYGNPQTWSDAMNVATTNLAAAVRSANSGRSNYDPSNLMIYYMSVGSVMSFIEWCKRLYGMVGLSAFYNRAIPMGLIRASGVNYTDLSANLAQFRSWLNQFIIRASIFGVPAHLPFFKRMQFIYANMYSDATNVRNQIHMYIPAGFHVYQEPPAAGALGSIQFTPLDPYFINALSETQTSGTAASTITQTTANNAIYDLDHDVTQFLTVSQIMAYGEAMLEPITKSQDFAIMSGDTIKCWGTEAMLQSALIPENYTVFPIYNLEVLHQIHNIKHCITTKSDGSVYKFNNKLSTIVEDTLRQTVVADNILTRTAASSWGGPTLYCDTILDFDLDNVAPADVMTSSRLVTMMKRGSVTSNVYDIAVDSCGNEICLYSVAYVGSGTGVTGHRLIFNTGNCEEISCYVNGHFRLAPLLFKISSTQSNLDAVIGDIQNFTVVKGDVMKRINDVAMLGLYKVPTIGTFKGK